MSGIAELGVAECAATNIRREADETLADIAEADRWLQTSGQLWPNMETESPAARIQK